MKIDILVLAHNNLGITNRFIKALYKHTDNSFFSLTILNNGSSDDTLKYISSLKSKIYVIWCFTLYRYVMQFLSKIKK